MMRQLFRISFLGIILALVGCKEVLYEQVNQQEANEMLALLLGNNISASKAIESSGTVTLYVEKDNFTRAIQILHQYGYPRSRQMTFDQLFPSGQLVTSPSQEQAKLVFFKEQQLENMFNQIDGVITSRVNIATCLSVETCPAGTVPTASILIKHSPEVNLSQYQSEIRSLVQHSIQHINYQDISVILIPAKYRYIQNVDEAMDLTETEDSPSLALRLKYDLQAVTKWIKENDQLLFIILISIALLTGLSIYFLVKRPFSSK